MFIDSHCHLSFPELQAQLPQILAEMQTAQVGQAVCICTTMEEFPSVRALAAEHRQLWATVGVHPDNEDVHEPSVEELVQGAQDPKVVAIGETGLDYYRLNGRSIEHDMEWQRQRFRTHIRAARQADKPLVIHTRSSAADTLRVLQEEGCHGHEGGAGGVFHCFTETAEVALAAVEMGFYVSFSGILTFKNAQALREVALQLPLERLLIETDSPYLAPVPHRGKTNSPAYVPHVAAALAELKGVSVEQVAEQTSANTRRLFKLPQPS
ncbi:TatD family hydrolase [Roseateles violae]|uniref:TatD family hydrolase n=1 Tax=Roseateles violae TaxID=3058042 RepID=A0ABT8DQL1_9BURK|nr:TatD family hydrolase [Pelomonas sp. PFR6]MDN3920636.1 TatD family hydrolase [Pelomonas sp. PFR6]